MVEEEITPRGDGNKIFFVEFCKRFIVEKEITPRGDGNEAL